MNGDLVQTSVFAEDGYNFRIILELWFYDEGLNEFQFGWGYGDELRCAWNQIWFNSTILVG